jgi:hypothetical protein
MKAMNEQEPDIMELLCAPEATDDLEDIEFDEDDDEAEEQDFIEGWIQEELLLAERGKDDKNEDE